jgi:glycosyltransferase involved in cell wall biosynthesis
MQFDITRTEGKRIVLGVHQFFPYFSAGTEVLTLSTAQALRAAGYTVEIITAKPSDVMSIKTSSYMHDGFTVHQLEIPFMAGRFSSTTLLEEYQNSSVYAPFKKILDKIKPDLVHFFHLKNLSTSALQACFDLKIPTVFTPTDYWVNCRSCQLVKPWGKDECSGPNFLAGNCLKHIAINQKGGLIRATLRLIPQAVFSALTFCAYPLKNSRVGKFSHPMRDLASRNKKISEALLKIDKILPPTLFIEELLLKSGIPKPKIKRLRYGIQSPIIFPTESQHSSIEERKPRIGFIGTLTEHKGCHIFLQALKKLPDADAEFVIYGDTQQNPEYFKKLEVIIGSDKRVRFMGTFPHQRIGNVLQALDTLVIPSTWRENAPLVLLNALACGTPVIASNVTGITEYLGEGDNVTVFCPGNSLELAQQLAARLALLNEPAHNRGIGRIAGEPLHAYISVLSGVYEELIQAHEELE